MKLNREMKDILKDALELARNDETAVESQGMLWMINVLMKNEKPSDFILNIVIMRLQHNIMKSPDAAHEMLQKIKEELKGFM
jgi:hypothetical protein